VTHRSKKKKIGRERERERESGRRGRRRENWPQFCGGAVPLPVTIDEP